MRKILYFPFSIFHSRRWRAGLPKKQKKPRWKREQAAKKVKKQKRLARTWLVVTAFLLAAGTSFKAIKIYQASVWRGEGRVSLVLPCQPLVVFSLSSQEQSLVSLLIPENTQIEVIHGYGQYKLSSIPKLEELEKRKLLSESVEQALGVPIEGFIAANDCRIDKSKDLKDLFLKSLSSALLGRFETNLSKWDLFRLFLTTRKVKKGSVEKLDLEALGVLSEIVLPDESRLYEITPERFDLKLKEYLWDEKARREGLAIEVLNGTDQPGLAEGAARILESMGLAVVGVGNAPNLQDECYLFGSSKVKKTYTARRLARIFDCRFYKEAPEKADLSLILGKSYWQKLSQR